jgi:hypothetical protein
MTGERFMHLPSPWLFSMPVRGRFQARFAVLLAAMLLTLTACSVVRTIYNQAANLAYWQLNRAFHLEDEQADQA